MNGRVTLPDWGTLLRASAAARDELIAGREELIAALEVALLFAFLLYYIWVLQPLSRAYAWPAFSFFMAFTLLASTLHGDSLADRGIRIDTLGRGLAEAAFVIMPGLAVAFFMGRSMEGGRPMTPERLTVSFFEAYSWAFFQQYGLQCFFNLRLRKVVPHPIGHDVVCAGIFAALHLPNPFLTVVTFGAAYCFCALFRRCPNLFALAAAHALSSSVLYYCLPPTVTHLMRVGPGYLQELRWH